MSAYLHFDGMTWPNPQDPAEVEHALRYGEPTREQLLVAASFIAAYKQLAWIDTSRERERKIAGIRRALDATREATEWVIRNVETGEDGEVTTDEQGIRRSWAQGTTWYDPDGAYELCRRNAPDGPWEVVDRRPIAEATDGR